MQQQPVFITGQVIRYWRAHSSPNSLPWAAPAPSSKKALPLANAIFPAANSQFIWGVPSTVSFCVALNTRRNLPDGGLFLVLCLYVQTSTTNCCCHVPSFGPCRPLLPPHLAAVVLLLLLLTLLTLCCKLLLDRWQQQNQVRVVRTADHGCLTCRQGATQGHSATAASAQADCALHNAL